MRMAWITTSDPSLARHRDDLEHVRGAVRAEVEHLAVVLVADRDSAFDRVQDVLIRARVRADR